MAERSPKEKLEVDKIISKAIANQAAREDLYLTQFAPQIRTVVSATLSSQKVKLQNLIPNPGAEIILAPESAEDLMYFVDNFGKFILSKYHTIYTDELATGMRLGGGRAPAMVLKDVTDCVGGTASALMPYETVDLAAYKIEGFMEQCWKPFVMSGLYGMTSVDLRQNTNFIYYFRTLIADVIYKEMLRLFWWGTYSPTAFSAATPELGLTAGVAAYFNVGYGLWRRIEEDVTIPYIDNTAYNAALTYALQRMTGDDAYQLISDCVREISPRSGQVEIHVTPYLYKSLLDKFAQTTDFNRGALSGRVDEINQIVGLFWGGYPIVNRLDWGDVIETFFDNGTRYDKPNRVFIYDKRKIAVAYNAKVLNSSAFGEISFDERTETAFKRFNHIFDARYLPSAGKLFVTSY